MESKSGASTTSFTEISGLRTKEKSAEYLWDRRASDQMSSQKVTNVFPESYSRSICLVTLS